MLELGIFSFKKPHNKYKYFKSLPDIHSHKFNVTYTLLDYFQFILFYNTTSLQLKYKPFTPHCLTRQVTSYLLDYFTQTLYNKLKKTALQCVNT